MVYDDPASKRNLFIGTEYHFKVSADIDLFLDEKSKSKNLLSDLLPEPKVAAEWLEQDQKRQLAFEILI